MRLVSITAAAATLVAAAALSACGGDDAGNGGDTGAAARTPVADVAVKTFIFDPDPLRVSAGETVTWSNADATVHTVTSGERGRRSGRFDGKLKPSGGRFSHTFERPGTYRYFCSRHDGRGMEWKVIVR